MRSSRTAAGCPAPSSPSCGPGGSALATRQPPYRRRPRGPAAGPTSSAASTSRSRRSWGTAIVRGIQLAEYAGYLDERATFVGQWGLRGSRGGSGPSYEELVETEGRPRLRMWLERVQTEGLLEAAVVYGYYPCFTEGDDLVVLNDDGTDRMRFTFPRQRRDRRLCLADFFRPATRPPSSVAPTWWRSSWSPWARGSPARPPSCSRRTPTATTWSCTACPCSSPRRSPSTGTPGSARSSASATPTTPSSPASCGRATAARATRSATPHAPTSRTAPSWSQLLNPERIGVELSEELQLHPEQSTDALVVHHPEAKYFNAT